MPVGMGEPEDDDPAQICRVSGVCLGRGLSHPMVLGMGKKRDGPEAVSRGLMCQAPSLAG
jgi:hypothetical protein